MTTDLWSDLVNSRPKVLVGRRLAAQKKREKSKRGGASLKVLSRLEALFDEAADLETEEIECLAAYRDVILHRGARADARFIEKTRVQTKEGELIELSGAVTTELLNGAIAKGTALLHLADRWLERNPV